MAARRTVDHVLLAPNLIKAMVEDVEKGKKSAEGAAGDLARQCGRNIFFLKNSMKRRSYR